MASLIDAELDMLKLIPKPLNFVAVAFFIVFGLSFIAWAGFAQFKIGKGTPIPAIPTQRLITIGPYALCRNPLLLGAVIYYSGINLWINPISSLMLTTLFLFGFHSVH